MSQSVKLLKCLTNVSGIVDCEVQVKEAMRSHIESVSDQVVEDNLGGIFGKKNAENGQYSIMISGHMDEVGFMVTKVDRYGLTSFTLVDGWWD